MTDAKSQTWQTKASIEAYAQKISAVDLTNGSDSSIAKDDPELPTYPEAQLTRLAYAAMRAVKFEANRDPEKRTVEKLFVAVAKNYKNCRGTNFLSGRATGDMVKDTIEKGGKDAIQAGAGAYAVYRRTARLYSLSINELVKGTKHMTNEYFAKLENK